MESKEYYLCTKTVVDLLNIKETSKPFKSGYKYDNWIIDELELFCIAVLNFEEVEKYYKENIDKFYDYDFWCEQCVFGQMDVDNITLASINRVGLFVEIENKIGLTKNNNRAMTIMNLTDKYNCNNPIEFVNKIKYK